MTTQEVVALIRSVSKNTGVDPDLAQAIAGHESEFDTSIVRYEPRWRFLVTTSVFSKKLRITQDTEIVLQSMSWGPMQVMGSVCRELGFTGLLTLMVISDIGILYGCRKLSALGKTYSLESDIIAAYNMGSPRKDSAGRYYNQTYVDDVTQRLSLLRNGEENAI